MKDENNYKVVFATNLARAIASSKLTRKELAEKIGVSYPAIATYLAGKEIGKGSFPSMDVAIRLADVLDVSIDELCGRAIPMSHTDGDISIPTAEALDAQQRLKNLYTAACALNFTVDIDENETVTLKSNNRFIKLFFEQLNNGASLEATLDTLNGLQVFNGDLVDPITYQILRTKEQTL